MKDRRFFAIEILKRTLLGLLVITGFSAIVMVLWNLLIPQLFGVKFINFWQALGIFALTRILFGHFGGGRPGERSGNDLRGNNQIREKWLEMTDEERKDFFNRRNDFFRDGPFSREDFWKRKTNRTTPDDVAEGEQ